MLKLGLIGYPLGHSLSPIMQKAALIQLGLEGSYVLLETLPEEIQDRIKYLKDNDFRGFNVTIPHKVEIMKFLDNIDNFAQRIGAVNTVVINENKKLYGYNTDVYGFIHAIPENIRKDLQSKEAVIVGSGGVARAVAAGIAEMGIKNLKIITLETEIDKAVEIKQLINKNFPQLEINCSILNEKINLAGISLVVNATPVGMEGKFEGISPLSVYSLDSLDKNAFVYDVVYKPQKTKLLELAEKRGFKILCGLDMLILQGARAFYLWTGKKPPVKVMKNVLLEQV